MRRFAPLLLAAILGGAVVLGYGALFGGVSETGEPGVASAAPAGEERVARAAAEVEPSVVQVNVSGVGGTASGSGGQQGVGSGIVLREDGYIVTNNHVVEGASEVGVAFADGTTEEGRVVGTDPATDVAVIRVDRRGLPAASFGDGRDLAPGQIAVAVGSPSGFQSTVTSGVVSGVGREIPATLTGGRQESALVDLIQTDAAISPGSSGGALADGSGEVIGMNVAYLPPGQTGAESIGFAIPAGTVTSVAEQLIETGEATQPYLGVTLSDLNPETARRLDAGVESGALVAEVEPDGPAGSAGLRSGDVVTALGSEPVRNSGDLLSALRRYRPGDTVEATVVRDGEETSFELRLGERGA
ncbi:PDZ domain-containing protein [Rubrobacter marinus]|uniref:PDZ domain-containing protein n=1 Tax=Rubrobacter marinus TaxID=2653852 RepID=A0A6G8PZS9_9ACTN|nr:trypsin-like peptidase domain-containing protein [Rubrobacter marinus]QIN79744.1 PDZ domain-containing protein [Rubrobacter marinus]